jgi:8-oxo-dGTP pyrophosphatase MutT (NUDIX family)
VSLATSAVILDGHPGDGRRLLLTRRSDTGLWCLPGGVMEPGESVSEAVAREVAEETGLEVLPERLIGVYSDPDVLATYADGVKQHPVVLCFRCAVTGGAPRISAETTEIGWFAPDDLPEIVEQHRQRITDALSDARGAYIR